MIYPKEMIFSSLQIQNIISLQTKIKELNKKTLKVLVTFEYFHNSHLNR